VLIGFEKREQIESINNKISSAINEKFSQNEYEKKFNLLLFH
jgi:hypothetical protein